MGKDFCRVYLFCNILLLSLLFPSLPLDGVSFGVLAYLLAVSLWTLVSTNTKESYTSHKGSLNVSVNAAYSVNRA